MKDERLEVAAGALKMLNRHGHAFEQAVIQFCHFVQRSKQSSWRFVLSECPIQLHGRPYHIDIVLEHVDTRALMVIECKRVDPARARWCFVKRRFTRADDTPDGATPVLSVIRWDVRRGNPLSENPHCVIGAEPFHLCVELKTNAAGDGMAPDPGGALNAAASQVFRGVSGLIERLRRDGGSQLPVSTPIMILPVVMTTADIWACSTSISDATLETGNLDNIDTQQVQWLWYQENLSRDLRPSIEPYNLVDPANPDSLERAAFRNHTRAACIVNVRHLHQFLGSTPRPSDLNPV